MLQFDNFWISLENKIMSQLVIHQKDGPIAILMLNRPERHNSLVPALLEELLRQIESASAQPELRAVILQANGRSFSTGGDMNGFYEHLEDIESYALEIVGLLNQVILALRALPAPVVAAVQGAVTGGSLGLVLAADSILVAPEASFTPYYSVVGFSPDGGWTAMLPDIIGIKRTADILMYNRTITAEQAVAWGLAGQIVPASQIRRQALADAEAIVSKKRGSLWHTKRLLIAGEDDLAERLESERTRFVQQITTAEARQGILDFMARRSRPAGEQEAADE
jgi:2-(1,2-epoxy-1,2-dihydrophenyl)acetyl-CoA isomerase